MDEPLEKRQGEQVPKAAEPRSTRAARSGAKSLVPLTDQMAARIALVEVAIGKTQTDKRTAKAAVIDFSTRAHGVNGKPATRAHRNWPSILTVPAGSL